MNNIDQHGELDLFNAQPVRRSEREKSDLERDIESGVVNINAMSSVDDGEEKQISTPGDADVIASSGAGYGTVLRRLRESRNWSYEELAEETCIKPEALRALENEDVDSLPPAFYIAAYIKKLCTLYGVSEELTEELSADVKSTLERTVPEDVSRMVKGHGVSEENEKRIRRLAIILVALVVVVAVVVVSGAALLVSHLVAQRNGNTTAISITYDEDSLLKLHDRPQLDIPRLPKKR